MSGRSPDARYAPFSVYTGQPAPAALMSFQVISPTFGLAAALASGLLAIDCAACLVVARLFDRERLITGARPGRRSTAPGTSPGDPPPKRSELSSVTGTWPGSTMTQRYSHYLDVPNRP